MTRKIRVAAVALACTAAGFIGGLYTDSRPDDVYCPEEDSCTIDYDGVRDQWVVTPTMP